MAGPFAESDDASVPYFAVSPVKLVAMSLATSGLYDLYWFYASWRQIEERTGRPKQPLGQALVLWLSLFSLAGRVNRSLGNRGLRRASVGVALPLGYLILRLLAGASGPLGLVSLSAIAPLALLQAEVRRANQEAGVATYRPGVSRWEVVAFLLLTPLSVLAAFDALAIPLLVP